MVVKRGTFRRQRFTKLTNSQWEFIKELVDNGRKRKYCVRPIINAILKVTRTGTQWLFDLGKVEKPLHPVLQLTVKVSQQDH